MNDIFIVSSSYN